jgi:hypothetical protein
MGVSETATGEESLGGVVISHAISGLLYVNQSVVRNLDLPDMSDLHQP